MNAQATLEAVVIAYVQCALWASTDDEGEPLDGLYEAWDFADEAEASMIEDVENFLDLVEEKGIEWRIGWTAEQMGHDFWLTRNRHGAGFWDRYHGIDPRGIVGSELTELAHPFGTSDVYVGDDGKLYVS
jgi:hypothetical protein